MACLGYSIENLVFESNLDFSFLVKLLFFFEVLRFIFFLMFYNSSDPYIFITYTSYLIICGFNA